MSSSLSLCFSSEEVSLACLSSCCTFSPTISVSFPPSKTFYFNDSKICIYYKNFEKIKRAHKNWKDLLSISMLTFWTLSSGAPKTERMYMMKMVDKINVRFVDEYSTIWQTRKRVNFDLLHWKNITKALNIHMRILSKHW